MKKHLHNARRMARVGLFIAAFSVLSDLMGMLTRGKEVDWRETIGMAVLMTALFAVGGAIYSMVLPRFTRGRMPPTGRAQLLAGMTAGALTPLLLLSPFLLLPTMEGLGLRAGLGLGAVVGGGFFGAICGLLTPNHHHPPAPPVSPPPMSPPLA